MPTVVHERAEPDHAQVQLGRGGEQKNFAFQRQLDGSVQIGTFRPEGGEGSASGLEVALHRRERGGAGGERRRLHVRPLQPAVPLRGQLQRAHHLPRLPRQRQLRVPRLHQLRVRHVLRAARPHGHVPRGRCDVTVRQVPPVRPRLRQLRRDVRARQRAPQGLAETFLKKKTSLIKS